MFDLLEHLDALRLDACRQLAQGQRGELGQFLTPAPVARLMASMFEASGPVVSILDAGAGVGSLFAAAVSELCCRPEKPQAIHVVAYEIDPLLLTYLADTVEICRTACSHAGIVFSAEVRAADFIKDIACLAEGSLFTRPLPPFSAVILNPPYRKINSGSEARQKLRILGVETTNLYTGFLSVAVELLEAGGEMVAITPRSFCNGTYFRGFRAFFLENMALQRIHLFESREEAFRDDAVLQETVIVHAVKDRVKPERVMVSASADAEEDFILAHDLAYGDVVHADDPEQFIRVVPDGVGQQVVARMGRFRSSLAELGLTVSTGRVVDFRVRDYLLPRFTEESAPLIYPINLESGGVAWPKQTKKPQCLGICKETELQFVPNENYVLVKRFSSKEQKRRVVTAVFEGGRLPGCYIGFENHLNYYHQEGRGMSLAAARGLSLYLSSTLVDTFFRLFNGHTQVNATDLRSLKYPTQQELEALGTRVSSTHLTQEETDAVIEKEFFGMAPPHSDPLATKRRIEEALEVLVQLGLPRAQLNERSALTLLALLDLGPSSPWTSAQQPLRGVTPIMDFMNAEYGKRYAPNTRETVRRQTVHQFLDAGLIVENPDKPGRPVNSPKTVYQIENSTLELLRTCGTSEWEHSLKTYLASVETLTKRYAQEREMKRIPVEIEPGKTITLSPGGQNVLVEHIINDFAPRFTPGGKMLYVGDTDEKFAYFDVEALGALGVLMDSHGKMPDVIIHYTSKNWLVIVEAVTSHGPIDAKRHSELQKLFGASTAGLVLVTAFLSRRAMVQYLSELSWETDVWIAESPTHMIHFNGERFLGPY